MPQRPDSRTLAAPRPAPSSTSHLLLLFLKPAAEDRPANLYRGALLTALDMG